MYGHTYSKSMDQPGKVASPARGQLNRKNEHFPVRLRIWSRETGSAVPSRVNLLIAILRLNLVLTYGIPPEFRDGVHSFIYNRHTRHRVSPELLSGHAVAYRWRSLPRVRRHGATKPQGIIVPNECCLGRSPWTNQYSLLWYVQRT